MRRGKTRVRCPLGQTDQPGATPVKESNSVSIQRGVTTHACLLLHAPCPEPIISQDPRRLGNLPTLTDHIHQMSTTAIREVNQLSEPMILRGVVETRGQL